ncbi:MAG: DUF305 domain-containing protein [Methanoregula sp.]
MSWKAIGLGIVILCIILTGVIIIAGTGGPSPVVGVRSGGMMAGMDRMFIEEMIPHHQDAVDMGEMALTKAEHPELRQLAGNIIRDQSREITLMKGWYREWYSTDVPVYPAAGGHGMMGGGMGRNMTDLGRLRDASSFDKEFIEQMIPHHQMAIMMGQMVMQNAEHGEIRELGSSIVQSQSAEVEMMRGWYRDWYGREVPSANPMGR